MDNLQQLHIPGASAPIPAALPNALVLKFSTDPELDAKVRDVLGLYLNPPEKAVVVCIDEKTQIQALGRTAPILPIRPGVPERQTSDYLRNGTTTLFAGRQGIGLVVRVLLRGGDPRVPDQHPSTITPV